MNNSQFTFTGVFVQSWAILLAGTLFVCPNQPARASEPNANNFRSFRNHHSDVERLTLRRIYNAARRTERQIQPGSTPEIHSLPSIGNTYVHPNLTRIERRLERQQQSLQSVQQNAAGRLIRLNNAIDLDLTSIARNITLGQNLFSDSGSINIKVGSESRVLTAGSNVTAAEYIAAKQALSGGQSLELDAAGKASGGAIDLSALTQDNDVMRASNLVVPKSVTATGDFGRRSEFRLLGDLSNYGTVNVLSTDSNRSSGTVRADDIYNFTGALISAKGELDLNLAADNQLINLGTIQSNGGLVLSGGSKVANHGVVSAAKQVTINAPVVANSGLIRSTAADVNLFAGDDSSLTVDNTNGVVSALNGAINVRSTTYNGTFDTTVRGGDLLSQQLNLNAGSGLIDVNAQELTGVVNETGLGGHVTAATDMMKLGTICLTGDPTFYNTKGSINIVGNVGTTTTTEPLVIVAAKDILIADGVTVSTSDSTQAQAMTLIAGASFTPTGGADSENLPPGTPGGVILSGKASTTGGAIILGTNSQLRSEGASIASDANGADMTLIAFGGKKGTNAGLVDLGQGKVITSGSNFGSAGDLVIISGFKYGDAVVLGDVRATGSSGGNVRIDTAAPVSSIKGQKVEYDITGNLVGGAKLIASTKLNKGGRVFTRDVAPGGDIFTQGDFTIKAGGITNNADVSSNDGRVEWFGITDIKSDSGVLNSQVAVDLLSNGDIGSIFQPLEIFTPNASVNTTGNNAVVRNLFAGNMLLSSASSKGLLNFQAVGSVLDTDIPITAKILELNASSFGTLSDLIGTTEVRLSQDDNVVLTSGQFGPIKTPSLDIFAAGSIGTAVTSFALPAGIKTFSFGSFQDVFLTSANKSTTFSQVVGNVVSVKGSGSITLGDKQLLSSDATDTFLIQTTGGSIKINSDITATNGLKLINTGTTTKDKLSIGKNFFITADSSTAGQGKVELSVGNASATPFLGPLKNINVTESGGVVAITGQGLTAKSPLNELTADGADLLINNGIKAGNISLGGGVIITAEQGP